MVKCLFLALCIPFLAYCGEFIATVDQNEIKVGEGFTLTLTLKEAQAKESPHIDILKKIFLVRSERQSSNTVMVNGKRISTQSWHIALMSLEEGDFRLPAMSIYTSEGILTSEPIFISVRKNVENSQSFASKNVELYSTVSKNNPYKNESFLYNIRLVFKRHLTNLRFPKVEIEDAIIELSQEPKVVEKIINGIHVNIIDFNYVITPLKTGPFHIPPVVLEGQVAIENQTTPLSLLDILQGFDASESFQLKTNAIDLEVQLPNVSMEIWLPAESLKVEEIFDEKQTLQEGEPFNRFFTIKAEGIKSSQIPSLSHLQGEEYFKVYADKPELVDEVRNQKIKSYRKEQYTLIPKQSGTLVLPEILLAWWDVHKKEKVVARIPARSVKIAPSSMNKTLSDTRPLGSDPTDSLQINPFWYALIGGVSTLSLLLLFPLLKKIPSLVKKLPKVKKKPVIKLNRKKQKEKLSDLNPT